MKIAAGKVEAFLATPDPAVRAVLVYGPDAGLVRERADTLMRTVVADLSDPFLVAELSADAVAKDPALLEDEAAAIAMTGGRRAIRVRDCADSVTSALKSMLAAASTDSGGDSLTVLQAGDLGPRSSLRRLAEGEGNAASLACYADDSRDLERVIRETLAADSLSVSHDASAFLSANLGADRGVTRSELNKLSLYAMGAEKVELEDAMAVVGDSAALSLDDLCYSIFDGDMSAVERSYQRSVQEGQSEIAILRAVTRHLLRLQLTVARIEKGEAPDRAMKALRPPVFFKRQRQFRRQAEHWSATRIAQALDLTLQAEMRCKSTGMPGEAISGRTVLQLAALGRRALPGGR